MKKPIAILIDPLEELPPSNKEAIEKFKYEIKQANFDVKLITQDSVTELHKFHSVLIRTATTPNNSAHLVAKIASDLKIKCIDDEASIIKYNNKIYTTLQLQNQGISTPKTLIISRGTYKKAKRLGFPLIWKSLNGSFSREVVKIKTMAELDKKCSNMIDLAICQQYVPTSFDWRIGIINNQIIYACKYHMFKNHWQIAKWDKNMQCVKFGECNCIKLKDVPIAVKNTALKASKLIGKGLYGIDIKIVNKKALITDINDNPTIYSGDEDQANPELYKKIIAQLI